MLCLDFKQKRSIPWAVTQLRRGKWWDKTEGMWIKTDLEKSCAALPGT